MVTILEVNLESGKKTERQMSSAELEQFEADELQREALAAEQAAKEAARQAALDKLSALGLTEDEVKALVGN